MLNSISNELFGLPLLCLVLQQVFPADLFAQTNNESITLPDLW